MNKSKCFSSFIRTHLPWFFSLKRVGSLLKCNKIDELKTPKMGNSFVVNARAEVKKFNLQGELLTYEFNF